jgi:hypothetical protein
MLNAGAVALGISVLIGLLPQSSSVRTLKSVGGLPAHIAGRFEEIGACERSEAGDYFIFDRRSHTVFLVPATLDAPPRPLVGVGVEPGRVLNPSAFDLALDKTFAIADAPYGQPRVQFFFETGARLGGFALPHAAPAKTSTVFFNLIASVKYSGKSLLVSQPESGTLIAEYSLDGRPLRSFGELRPTGYESDRDLHNALNAGRIVINPRGGFYFVFSGGTPLFRKYDAAGKLLFERYIQGAELDEYARTRPTTWPKRAGPSELPFVAPAVRAAAADAAGNLWISLVVPFTYVYDAGGDKIRTVQFSSAGILSPTGLSFGSDGRLLVTPGCYSFEPGPVKGAPARNGAALPDAVLGKLTIRRVSHQPAGAPEIEVEILQRQIELSGQLADGVLQPHQGEADGFGLI